MNDIVTRYENLKLKAITIRSKKGLAEEAIKSNKLVLISEEEELASLNKSKITIASSLSVMKQLIDVMSSSQINQLKDLITYGLKSIFIDRDYALDIVISESRNAKQASFVLVETLKNGDVIRSDFKDSIGGGVIAVVGLIIQVYYIIYYKEYPVIFMDEALSQISTQYLPAVMQFIDELATKKKFKFVLVTHDDRILDYGKDVYSVTSGVVRKVR